MTKRRKDLDWLHDFFIKQGFEGDEDWIFILKDKLETYIDQSVEEAIPKKIDNRAYGTSQSSFAADATQDGYNQAIEDFKAKLTKLK